MSFATMMLYSVMFKSTETEGFIKSTLCYVNGFHRHHCLSENWVFRKFHNDFLCAIFFCWILLLLHWNIDDNLPDKMSWRREFWCESRIIGEWMTSWTDSVSNKLSTCRQSCVINYLTDIPVINGLNYQMLGKCWPVLD